MSIELPAIIERIICDKNNFYVLACNLDATSDKYKPEMEKIVEDAISQKYNTFTVVLTSVSEKIYQGGQYIFVGNIENDSKRGIQFKAEFCYMDTPSSVDGMRSFLMVLPNIKEVRSQSMIEKWGVEGVIKILDSNPDKLLEIPGITKKRLEAIKKEWDVKRKKCELYHWLSSHNISITLADKVFQLFGDRSITILQEDPYRLCDIRGIGFLTADNIAHKILKEVPFNSRIKACVRYVIEEQTISESNLCAPYSLVKRDVCDLIAKCDLNLGNKSSSSDKCIESISNVLKEDSKNGENAIFELVKDTEEVPNVIYIYKMDVWKKEKYIGESLYTRTMYKPLVSNDQKRIMDKMLKGIV